MRASHRNFNQSPHDNLNWASSHSQMLIPSYSHFLTSSAYAHVSFPVYLPHHHWRRLKRALGVFSFTPPLWRFESRHSSWNSTDPLLRWLQCFHYKRLELELERERGGGSSCLMLTQLWFPGENCFVQGITCNQYRNSFVIQRFLGFECTQSHSEEFAETIFTPHSMMLPKD